MRHRELLHSRSCSIVSCCLCDAPNCNSSFPSLMALIFKLNFSRQARGLGLSLSRHISGKMVQLFLRMTSGEKDYFAHV